MRKYKPTGHDLNQVNENLVIHASGTPPTRVLTVNSPQLAASNMAMQKASVKELQKGGAVIT